MSPLSADAVMVTVTVLPLAGDSVTLNDTTPNVSDTEASSTLSVGRGSSSMIVPVAVGSAASCTFVDTPDSVTVNVSFSSSVKSSAVGTVNVVVVAPTGMVTVPVATERSVKSAATAVSPLPIDAVQVAVTSSATASDNVTVKVTSSPSSPSLPSASPTLSVGLGSTAVPLMAMRSVWSL